MTGCNPTNTRWIKAGPRHSNVTIQHNIKKAMALKIHLLKFASHTYQGLYTQQKTQLFLSSNSHFIFLELQDIHLQLVLFFIQITFLSICLSYFPAFSFHNAQRNLHSFSLSASALQPLKIPTLLFPRLQPISVLSGKCGSIKINFLISILWSLSLDIFSLCMQTLRKASVCTWPLHRQCKCTLHRCRSTICRGMQIMRPTCLTHLLCAEEISLGYSPKGQSEVHFIWGLHVKSVIRIPSQARNQNFWRGTLHVPLY